MVRKTALLAFFMAVLSPAVFAANYKILDEQLDTNRQGYTVLRVWGTHYEMGYAMGSAFAADIATGWSQIKSMLGSRYQEARTAFAQTTWLPAGIEDEINGIVDAVIAAQPGAGLDAIDLKIMNTYSDWAYACRSHTCWGRYVQAPIKTLSTRRLDFSTPFPMALHHVLCAWDPSDGSVRWVNMAWPGYVTVITGVNAYGTLVSLHDYNSHATFVPGVVPRSVATREVLTGMDGLALPDQLTWAEQQISAMTVATGTFLNDYSPEGLGGVFTCTSGGSCGALRVPQADYFFGEVMMTTNSQTDGHTVPSGGEFMDTYYQAGYPKDLTSHYELMGHTGLHLMSVAYRGEQDMTLWAEGRASQGTTKRIEVEWSDLFPTPALDGGTDAGIDAGTDAGVDAGLDAGADPGRDSGVDGSDGSDSVSTPGTDTGGTTGGGGCGCGADAGAAWLALLPLVLALGRRTRNA